MNLLATNAQVLEQELTWFSQVLEARIAIYFQQEGACSSIYEISPPDYSDSSSAYSELIQKYQLDFDQRIVLMLALISFIRPQALDTLFIRNKNLDRSFTEFGGYKGKSHSGFLPTCETAVFILAGDDLQKRFELNQLFDQDNILLKENILKIGQVPSGEPLNSVFLTVTNEILNRLTTGLYHKPDYSIDFPAKLIETNLDWDDLVLPYEVKDEIDSIIVWMENSHKIMQEWGYAKTIKPGYRALFYGPPGTGKTLTATLMGKRVGVDVYRIDLSMVISKYIGETEKNLASVFDQAASKNWILFFDEADALFGKRTQSSSSNDRYANQEIAYLLQRIEDFPGVVILATNLKANIDEAFARRFQSLVFFPMPEAEERYSLWECTLNDKQRIAEDVDLKQLSERYELTGGAITNVVRYGAINALKAERGTITHSDLVRGIGKELRKEGKTVTI